MGVVGVVAVILVGVGVILALYRRQWHVRLLREIRALPEHRRRH